MQPSTLDPPGNGNGARQGAETIKHTHEYLARFSIIFGSPSSLIAVKITEASASVQILCHRAESAGVLGDLERKLLRLALDHGAAVGEIRNSAVKLIESWRARGICVEDFDDNGTLTIDSVGTRIVGFGKYAAERVGDLPSDYLGWMVDTPGIQEKHPDIVRAALAVLKRRGIR